MRTTNGNLCTEYSVFGMLLSLLLAPQMIFTTDNVAELLSYIFNITSFFLANMVEVKFKLIRLYFESKDLSPSLH